MVFNRAHCLRLLAAACLCFALAPGIARAADPVALPPVAAAGVLEQDGRIDCSGVLIAPDLVATAAHCVHGKKLTFDGGESTIIFRTGGYPGHPQVEREAVALMLHPIYLAARVGINRPMAADMAVIALDAPINSATVRAIPVGDHVREGEGLLIASYPGGQGQRARERLCPALTGDGTMATLSCVVRPGESGAPVIRLTEDGPELAGIVIAKSRAGRQPYALAVQAGVRLRQIMAVYRAGTP